MIDVKFNSKQIDQENEYKIPVHWMLTRCIKERYERISRVISVMIEKDSTNTTSILEIGCGDGKSLSDLYQLTCGKFEYVGIDYSERAISFAKQQSPLWT